MESPCAETKTLTLFCCVWVSGLDAFCCCYPLRRFMIPRDRESFHNAGTDWKCFRLPTSSFLFSAARWVDNGTLLQGDVMANLLQNKLPVCVRLPLCEHFLVKFEISLVPFIQLIWSKKCWKCVPWESSKTSELFMVAGKSQRTFSFCSLLLRG